MTSFGANSTRAAELGDAGGRLLLADRSEADLNLMVSVSITDAAVEVGAGAAGGACTGSGIGSLGVTAR